MSTKKTRQVNARRRYSKAFKQARVKDFENGTFSVNQMCRLYHIPMTTLYRWIHQYSRHAGQNAVIVEVPNSQTEKVKALEKQVAELERSLGRKQIKLDYYQCLMEELEAQGIEVKKKDSSTKLSND